MFGKSTVLKEYASVVEKLESGQRRAAVHVRPRAVTDSGFERFATEGVLAVFEGFEFFGALMNRQVSDPWTIEERGKTLVAAWDSDSPELGRTYSVSYNSVDLGRIQVAEGFNMEGGFRESLAWHREHRAARVYLELDYLRFIPYDDALSFVAALELLVGTFDNGDSSRHRAKVSASATLSGYLWEVVRAGDTHLPRFYHRTEGPYDLLKHTTDRWKNEGLDPFALWNGDRPA